MFSNRAPKIGFKTTQQYTFHRYQNLNTGLLVRRTTPCVPACLDMMIRLMNGKRVNNGH